MPENQFMSESAATLAAHEPYTSPINLPMSLFLYSRPWRLISSRLGSIGYPALSILSLTLVLSFFCPDPPLLPSGTEGSKMLVHQCIFLREGWLMITHQGTGCPTLQSQSSFRCASIFYCGPWMISPHYLYCNRSYLKWWDVCMNRE